MKLLATPVIRPATRRLIRLALGACLVSIVAVAPASSAEASQGEPDDADALRGVTTGRVVFDINTTDPSTLASYLGVIERTHDDLLRQEVRPDIVLAVRGIAVIFISTDRGRFDQAERKRLDEVAQVIGRLIQKGARVEACAIAMRAHEVGPETLLEGIQAVGNTFVSLTGYQAQGYGVIPNY